MLFAQRVEDLSEIKSAEYETGYFDGIESGSENYSEGRWFVYGLAGGLFVGLIGSGAVVGFSQYGTVFPSSDHDYYIQDQTSVYKIGFYDGYSKEAKRKRLKPSIIGGLLGTAMIVAILTSGSK